MSQLSLLKKPKSAYGGDLMKTRQGRVGPRILATRQTMHLVLRASRAKGAFSFRTASNSRKIREIVARFSERYGVKVISLANVGNHLHFHIKLSNRFTYVKFIRAVTAAIAMAVTGRSRWNSQVWSGKFWDYRPFTRVLQSYQEYLNLNDYIQINAWEGLSIARTRAVYFMQAVASVRDTIRQLRRVPS